jgi:hypothetical protein
MTRFGSSSSSSPVVITLLSEAIELCADEEPEGHASGSVGLGEPS